MKYLVLFVLSILSFQVKAQIYNASEMYVHFLSPAPIADIEAISNAAKAKLNLDKKEVEIEIPIASFKFKKALMQTHFNEKYIESDKYPFATYKARFKENIDLDKEGTYSINLEGKFIIHGVDRQKTINCIITVKNHQIRFETTFKLLSADYKIKAPDMIYRKVGQEVTIDANGLLVREKD